jgi:hypothetical protein
MLLEHLYRISLEEREMWAMYIGLPANTLRLLDVRIDLLRSYISGYRSAEENDEEAAAFFDWLIDDQFPTRGWVTKCLEDCNGDHLAAITKFWGLLHEYLLDTRPSWLLHLNSSAIPSGVRNGAGVPRSFDIRNKDHMEILGLA